MLKQKGYSSVEEAMLLAIAPSPKQRKQIQRAANRMKRNYATVYAKWHYMHNGRAKTPPTFSANRFKQGNKIVAVPAPKGKDIVAYVLEEGAELPTRGDRASTLALKAKLRPLLDMMEVDRHSLPIHKVNRGTVRKWLSEDKHFKNLSFTISPIKDNPNMVRIFRKA